jgi:hypothetical protein
VICADIVTLEGGAQVIAPAATQPADLGTCAVVLIPGAELSALSGVSFPAPADAATVWAWAFSMVVGSYLIGWGAGTVVNFVKRN